MAASHQAGQAETTTGGANASVEAYRNSSERAAAQLALAHNLRDILTDDSRSRRAATFDAAQLTLAERKEMFADRELTVSDLPQPVAPQLKQQGASADVQLNLSVKSQLAAQQTKLRGARDLLAAVETDSTGVAHSLSLTTRLTERAVTVQVARRQTDTRRVNPNDVTLPATSAPDHDTPVAATMAILEAHDVEPTDEQADEIQQLSELPESHRHELTDVLNAYLAYQQTVQESDGADVRRVRAAQLQLLEAAADLEAALDDTDTPESVGPASQGDGRPTVQIDGVVSIDLSRTSTTYTDDYALQIDVGGDDIYNNNAGGANASGDSTDAAALIDLGGQDTYNGRNGGGRYVVTEASPSLPPNWHTLPKKGEAAGFLLDAGTGDDTYNAHADGSNGGGRRGIGFLVDTGGDDTYNGSGEGTNGAGNKRGTGFLLDGGVGDDTYHADDEGISNGGAKSGHGFLFDVGGNDTYVGSNGKGARRVEPNDLYPMPINCETDPSKEEIRQTPCQIYFFFAPLPELPESGGFLMDGGGSDIYTGSNGAGGTRGTGFLLDAGTSNDSYYGESERGIFGANGAGARPGASGFLLDLGGNDKYLSTSGTKNGAGLLYGMGFLLDGGGGDDTYNAATGSGPSGPWSNLDPGSLGTNGGGWMAGHGFLADAGGNDSYLAGSVGTNGGAVATDGHLPQGPPGQWASTGFLLDVAGDDRYVAGESGVNGGASRAVGLLYDNRGADNYTDDFRRCNDCSDVPKGTIGAQVDGGIGEENASRRVGSSEVLVVDDTVGTGEADCPDASYQAIQPAVNAATYGDTVQVCTGTYPGNVTVDTSNVTLQAAGSGQVILDGEHKRRFGVALVAGQTTVTGFTATNFTKNRAAFVALGPATTVTDTTSINNTHGIITAGFYRGGALHDIPATIPVSDERDQTVIANNTVAGGNIGISVSRTGNVRISSNTISATQHGIFVLSGKGITIHNNTVSGHEVPVSGEQGGVTSALSGDITMTGNSVTGFTAPDHWQADGAFGKGYGIKIRRGPLTGGDPSHTLRNNTMADNKFNLVLQHVPDGAYKHFTISPSNTVNGEPVIFLVGAMGVTIGPDGISNLTGDSSVVPDITMTNTKALGVVDTPGYVACVRCVNVTVRDLELSHNGHGVLYVKSRGVQVTNVTAHDTVWGISLRDSPTTAEVTNNTVRDTKTAINVAHNCDPRRRTFDETYREMTSGDFAACATPSVLVAHNTITRAARGFADHGGGTGGVGGAIMVSGTGVTVRENTISNVQGAGISVRGGPALTSRGGGLFKTGLQVSPASLFPSTVIDNAISDARVGVTVKGTQGTTVTENTIKNTVTGLYTTNNHQVTYRDNTVTNATTGMFVSWTELDLTVRNNRFQEVRWGLDVYFIAQGEPPRAPASHDFGTSNTVNGERILWLTGAAGRTIDAADANMVVCVRCVDVTIQDMTITDNADGIVLWDSRLTRVTNVTVTDTLRTGILIRGGANNTVEDSTIIDSTEPIWVWPIQPADYPDIRRISPVDRPNRNQRDTVGAVRIVNNRIAVENASFPHSWPVGRAPRLTYPAIWGHFGIALYEPAAATVTGNTITDNRWGIHVKRGELSTTRIANNTVTHAREPTGRNRDGYNLAPDLRSTFGIKVQGNVPDSSNGSVVIHNNSLSAGVTPPGSMDFIRGITVKGKQLPQTRITDNTVQGYKQSIRFGTSWNNTTASIRRNRLTGAQSASVFIQGQTPGDAVEIHQNLLNPLQFGYGVKYSTKAGGGGDHMMSGGSDGSDDRDMAHGTLPVNATCNRWAAPSGPSSQRMTLVDPVTGEPADGNGSAVSRGQMHHGSNVHFHPWLGESPRLTCAKEAVGTATPTPPPTPTRTPWPTRGPGDGTGPGPGDGTGPGPGDGTGPGQNSSTGERGGEGTSTATAEGLTTVTPTATPPPTATPEIVPGFGVSVWLVAYVLLVGTLAVRRWQ